MADIEHSKIKVKTQIILRALSGTMRSRPLDVDAQWIGGPIYFAHINRSRMRIVNWQILPADYLDDGVKKLKFEHTGRVFWKKKSLTAVYEYELTEV